MLVCVFLLCSEFYFVGGHLSFSSISFVENIVCKWCRSCELSIGCGGIAVQCLGDFVSF